MEDQALKELIRQGLMAMKAGSKVAENATQDIISNAQNEQLKTALDKGNTTSAEWKKRIDRSVEEAGGGGEQENPILEAHYKVSKEIVSKSPDQHSRDLGIIASGQLALHYWIASFGTMASYTKQAGLDQTQKDMHACLEEAKQADQELTQVAQSIMAAN